MSRVVIIGAQPRSMINFRGALIEALVQAGHTVTAMTAPATPGETGSLRTLGADHRAYPVQRNRRNPLADVRTYWSLRTALRELQPDVILAYTIKPIIWGGLAARGLRTARFYGMITGLGFAFQTGGAGRFMLRGLVALLYRVGLQRAVGVVFQNHENAAEFIERRIVPSAKCSITAGSGVNLAHFRAQPMPAGPLVFLMVSRLLGEKGLREFTAAARIVRAKHDDVQCWLVGPEDPSPDGIPLREVQSWERQGGILYKGAHTDVRPWLAASTVFVLPSYHEGMPKAVLEALATGRPIITTDVPGCRETVVPSANGFLVPKGNADALAACMCWCVENRHALAPMARASRMLAEERFSVDEVNRQLLALMHL